MEAAIECVTENTLAIIATHLYGNVVDVPALRLALTRAGKANVFIIEDCAQSHGAKIGEVMAGAAGDLAAFSFYPTKNLGAMGDAGAVVTRSAEFAGIVRSLHQYGWSRKYTISQTGKRNSRMDEIQAAILLELLPELDRLNAERKAIIDVYRAAAPADVEFVHQGASAIVHLAVVRTLKRDDLRAHLTRHGISHDIHYPVLDHEQPGWGGQPARVAPDGLPKKRWQVVEWSFRCLASLA